MARTALSFTLSPSTDDIAGGLRPVTIFRVAQVAHGGAFSCSPPSTRAHVWVINGRTCHLSATHATSEGREVNATHPRRPISDRALRGHHDQNSGQLISQQLLCPRLSNNVNLVER